MLWDHARACTDAAEIVADAEITLLRARALHLRKLMAFLTLAHSQYQTQPPAIVSSTYASPEDMGLDMSSVRERLAAAESELARLSQQAADRSLARASGNGSSSGASSGAGPSSS